MRLYTPWYEQFGSDDSHTTWPTTGTLGGSFWTDAWFYTWGEAVQFAVRGHFHHKPRINWDADEGKWHVHYAPKVVLMNYLDSA